MAPLAIGFGVLLSLLGPILWEMSNEANRSPTAFIPTAFGIVLILLGILARNEKYRMHAMHGAAVVGLLGVVMPLGRLIFASTLPTFQFGLAAGGSIAMAVLCAIFLGLCVKSFIDARIARKKKEAETTGQTGS